MSRWPASIRLGSSMALAAARSATGTPSVLRDAVQRVALLHVVVGHQRRGWGERRGHCRQRWQRGGPRRCDRIVAAGRERGQHGDREQRRDSPPIPAGAVMPRRRASRVVRPPSVTALPDRLPSWPGLPRRVLGCPRSPAPALPNGPGGWTPAGSGWPSTSGGRKGRRRSSWPMVALTSPAPSMSSPPCWRPEAGGSWPGTSAATATATMPPSTPGMPICATPPRCWTAPPAGRPRSSATRRAAGS